MKIISTIIIATVVGGSCGAFFAALVLGLISCLANVYTGFLSPRNWALVGAILGARWGVVPGLVIGLVVGVVEPNISVCMWIGGAVGSVMTIYFLTYRDLIVSSAGIFSIPVGALVGFITGIVTNSLNGWVWP